MQNIIISKAGQSFTFRVKFEDDNDTQAPWIDNDGHGPVTGWESRDKLPGELVLNNDRGSKRFYDYAEACHIALRDKWDAKPYNTGNETPRQQAAKAAMADYENLRAWCNDEWRYVGVIVTLLDDDGEETEVSQSLWGVEDKDDYNQTVAQELAEGLVSEYGKTWGRVTRETYGMLAQEAS